jgi:acetyl esterase/lipase
MYLQGHDPKDALASPLFADVTGFPPVLLFAGGHEVLLEDSTAFASRLALAGVSVEAHLVAGMQHVWPTLFPELEESSVVLHQISEFFATVRRPD